MIRGNTDLAGSDPGDPWVDLWTGLEAGRDGIYFPCNAHVSLGIVGTMDLRNNVSELEPEMECQ